MPGNTFGHTFRVTTFGESHGPLVGVVIDGVPAGLQISEEDIELELRLRRPGGLYVSRRRELDKPEIVSGIFNGRTTGAPLTIIVRNVDVDSRPYEEIRYKPRPGHADLPYVMKYGLDSWDYRGGGRASARETVSRVAAGAVAKKLLMALGVVVASHVVRVGPVELGRRAGLDEALRAHLSPVRVCCREFEEEVMKVLEQAIREGDSWGGVVETVTSEVPPGLGEPVFDKLKADLAKAVMSIPGSVGVEFGEGLRLSSMRGSEASDEIVVKECGRLGWRRNVQGGIVGGLSTGEPIVFRTYFKPTSSIRKPVRTVDLRTLRETEISVVGRHDPCIAIRAAPVVEAMTAVVLVDHALRAGLIDPVKLSPDEVRRIEERWSEYVKFHSQILSQT